MSGNVHSLCLKNGVLSFLLCLELVTPLLGLLFPLTNMTNTDGCFVTKGWAFGFGMVIGESGVAV